ncbi:MAG TPA: sigma factor-like helix-turn-helix DNA-binding protein [Ilumatobacteraceae bacterium]|nr:sigma factor-like helix-turn-helix DNA-binding protein [Ilumatobacteraceae bacterium]
MTGTGTLVGVDAPEQTDADLLARVASGDRRALEVLYRRHAQWILLRLHHRCTDPDMVDTALQDTFVSAWRSAGAYRADLGEVGAWLWSIAVRRLIDQLRRRRPATPVAQVPEPEPLPPPGTPAHALLSKLPADLHPVVRAVYLDGLTTAEAAVLLGIPQGTVKSRLARARPLLQEQLR